MKLTRFDLGLILALVFTSSAWGMLHLAYRPKLRQQEGLSSWQRQEEQVQERLRQTFIQDPGELKARIEREPALLREIKLLSAAVFLLLMGSLWGVVRLIWKLIRGQPIVPSLGSPPAATWTLREILRLVAGVVLLVQWALLIQGLLLVTFRPAWADRHLLALGNTLLIDLLVLGGAGSILLRQRQKFLRPLSLTSIRFGIGSYLTSLPFLGVLVLMVSIVLQMLHQEPSPQAIFTIYLSEKRALVLGWLLALVAVIGPVAEELFFRGVLYGWLRTRIGIGWALGVSAFLFSALHTDPFAFAPIFGLGLLFGWVYERTGTLAAPITIHVFHNAGMLTLASLVKQILSLS